MGMNPNALRFLFYSKSVGVDFGKTAMIGRQALHLSFNKFSSIITREFNYNLNSDELKELYNSGYCEDVLKFLGAETVHSFDYSDYEGSTHIHDFNQPVPEELFMQYSTVLESGTLEHVFNFPVAIKNCMNMIKRKGHFLGMMPTNNYMGHGFYQFSPELFYGIFSAENGFRIQRFFSFEERDIMDIREKRVWFNVPDPKDVKCRVGISNSTPTLLLILANKTSDKIPFSTPPLQADYVEKYVVHSGVADEIVFKHTENRLPFLKRLIPRFIIDGVKSLLGSYRFSRMFTPFRETDIGKGTSNE
jgi:hypothetical protein